MVCAPRLMPESETRVLNVPVESVNTVASTIGPG
jgi:hypothetical protein